MNVLIWGYYFEGNFGDDAMGLIFANEVRKLGHEPIIYGDGDHLREHIDAKISPLLPDCDLHRSIILGGGGFMTSLGWRHRLFGSFSAQEKAKLTELDEFLKNGNRHLVPISIGGDKRGVTTLKKQILVTNCQSGTVRLKSDLDRLRRVGIDHFEEHADILWLISRFFQSDHKPDRKSGKVGFNLKARHATKQLSSACAQVCSSHGLRPINVTSHVDLKRYSYENQDPLWDTLSYSGDILEFARQLGQLSVIVSSKLHVGLVAMSFGIPFISYRGPEKAKSALMEMGLDDFIIDNPRELESMLQFVLKNHQSVTDRVRKIAEREINSASDHVKFLKKTLDPK